MLAVLFTSTQGISFITVLAAGFVYLMISGLMSAGEDVSHEAGADAAGDHPLESNHPTISIFSPRIIAIFAVGLGGGGAIATFYGLGLTVSVLVGLGLGFILGGLGSIGMKMLYSQQASSEVRTENALGRSATVTVDISAGNAGEIGLTVQGQYMTYLARAKDPSKNLPKGTLVKVVQILDGVIIVE